MSKKSFQKKKVRYIATLLSSLIVAFSFMPTFQVFASSQSVGTPDRDVLSYSYFSGSIYPTQAAFHVEAGTNELVVPVFYNMSNFPDVYNMAYLSGYVIFQNIGLNVFGSDTSAPVNVNPEWFESVNSDTIQVAWNTSYSLRIYFNNFRILDNSSNNRIILLGYIHYTFDEPSSAFWYQFPTANKQVNAASNGIMYGSAYEYGLADSIIYAIDTSTDIEQIITWLSDISQNTALLSTVVTNLQNINGILGSIFNYLGTLNTNQQNAYRQLIWALSGVDFASTSASALSTATYNRWVQLIYDAINYQGPDSSQADQAADDLEAAHDMNDQAQESAYAYMDSAIDDIDFQITVPQGLINSALTIGGYITQIWQNAGSDFQFLVTATLTIGLITVIIGAINRYPKTVTDSDTTQETYGVRNGKPYRHISRTRRHTTHHSK